MSSQQILPSTPRWFTALDILCTLPVFLFPGLLATCPPDLKAMVWVYPFYIIVAAYLAWQCYPQRSALAWILLVLIILSHAAIWLMATSPLKS